ncbi:hypothetical protein N657DRAFT_573828 [Parathielavia appendiculata]|uniref:Uncharacterized protein n=1 Tax=Parathielavia appendiculata TaxID=2587402 RepID=A0AAN6U102_9PEZI|nr:hypothetical protein N657DRAFT_573828 [Parathielavia appendiculata]
MSQPPPPPPPHGENPRTTAGGSGLPPGKYDVFIIPEHSAGSGFLYLPSLKPQWNSFIAGVVSTLAVVIMTNLASPVVMSMFSSPDRMWSFLWVTMVACVGIAAFLLGRHRNEPTGRQNGDGGRQQSQPEPQPQAQPRPQPQPQPQAQAPPPPQPPPQGQPQPEPKPAPPEPKREEPKEEPKPKAGPPPEPKPQPQAPPPRPASAKSEAPKGAWEKAREEMRRREEERKAKEAEAKRKEDTARRLRELREREAREREKRESEARERELKEKLRKEQEAREREPKEKEEARKREEERQRAEKERQAARERERKEREERLARLRKEQEEREKKEREAKETQERNRATYAYSSVGEKTSMWPNGKPPSVAPSQAASTPPPPRPTPSPTPPSPSKPAPSPTRPAPSPTKSTTSATGTEDTYSYRPYDKPKKPTARKKSVSDFSESSWAPSASTARTTPPPSTRGPYTTNDPQKIIIKAVYGYLNQFSKTPASQLISGVGPVTDGLILRITSAGLFVDDDVRGVAQREWDIKAWTLKLVEVWCPVHAVQGQAGNTPGSVPTNHPFFKTMPQSARRAAERGATKTMLGEEAVAWIDEFGRVCDGNCRRSKGSSAAGGSGEEKGKGLHLIRATIRDQEGKRYLFVVGEEEAWKIAGGLAALRGSSQVRALSIAGFSGMESKTLLDTLGWTS